MANFQRKYEGKIEKNCQMQESGAEMPESPIKH
jgi:hypothetical protein